MSSRPPYAKFPDPPRTRLLQSIRIPPIDPTAARPHLLRAAPATMSSKYAFTKALKERRDPVRFLDFPTHAQRMYTPTSKPPNDDDDTNRSHHLDPPLTPHRNSNFVARAYPTMKKNNPQTPILIREAAGTLPKIYARYEFGVEKSQSLEGLSDKQIEDTVTTLTKTRTFCTITMLLRMTSRKLRHGNSSGLSVFAKYHFYDDPICGLLDSVHNPRDVHCALDQTRLWEKTSSL
ncbi:uncharacterized protein CLUP02_14606 [Colletotrichum lupini]|uniref:Ribosomal protein/NADH dehydrogenase domain-containing protein n=1 Tax=Colletotrichum lupini TaxID=145971 RepID=A0A9Q8WMH5_9PEZI|nr:uncharacterized protein CLUP02_14606 [Colletotrichum lupini]UQC89078.1 hypothetical protein CLUP02_14606 [Colletotrichum lupini]